jgi:hypothetical protein
LKAEHNTQSIIDGDLYAITQLANIIILTIYTLKIAVCQEDGARSTAANQFRLLPKVWAII